MITAHSIFNGLVLQVYSDSFNFPSFVEIPKNETSSSNELLTQELTNLAEYSENSFPILDDKSIEDKLNNRELEKQLFRGILEVVLFSFLFLTIIIISYDHSYINLKIYSNNHLKNLISTNTSWNSVS
jgi:hypothetical protein